MGHGFASCKSTYLGEFRGRKPQFLKEQPEIAFVSLEFPRISKATCQFDEEMRETICGRNSLIMVSKVGNSETNGPSHCCHVFST